MVLCVGSDDDAAAASHPPSSMLVEEQGGGSSQQEPPPGSSRSRKAHASSSSAAPSYAEGDHDDDATTTGLLTIRGGRGGRGGGVAGPHSSSSCPGDGDTPPHHGGGGVAARMRQQQQQGVLAAGVAMLLLGSWLLVGLGKGYDDNNRKAASSTTDTQTGNAVLRGVQRGGEINDPPPTTTVLAKQANPNSNNGKAATPLPAAAGGSASTTTNGVLHRGEDDSPSLLIRRGSLGRPYFMHFGDSITEFGWKVDQMGWVAQMANRYSRYADIRDRGYSGYNTRDAVLVLHEVFPLGQSSLLVQDPPRLVTVFFGANDVTKPGAWIEPDGTDHHVPLSEYESNLRVIVHHLRRVTPDMPIILIAPPPNTHPARSNALAQAYARAVVRVGLSEGVPVIDTWTLLQGSAGADVFSSYLVDGLHLNDKGNSRLVDALWEVLASEYPHLQPGTPQLPRQQRDPW